MKSVKALRRKYGKAVRTTGDDAARSVAMVSDALGVPRPRKLLEACRHFQDDVGLLQEAEAVVTAVQQGEGVKDVWQDYVRTLNRLLPKEAFEDLLDWVRQVGTRLDVA